MIGRTLGHYRIESKLGEGGMGIVYKARDLHLDRPVAIKVLSAEAVADAERKRRFVQEAKAASALNHPNIITIYDIDRSAPESGSAAAPVDFIAMEYVAGKTLEQAIGSERCGLKLEEAVKYALQAADALAKAHAAGIVHRDLKPANIMATEEGLVKVLDFGLAKLTETVVERASEAAESLKTISAAPTEQGTILGTVAYMSPEQAEGKKVDARSDIFSFGTVLYEIVTGQRPFQGETKVATLAAILNQNAKPVREILAEIPRGLERIIGRCLRKDPRQRFQMMEDVKIALEDLEWEASPATPAGATPHWSRATIFAAALVVALAGAAWWASAGWIRPEASRQAPVLKRLTSDSGLTIEPALSPDGRLVAYASDRAGEGNLDIWVQQLAGGEPMRLTRDKADEREPSFSPDGSRIAFRSQREGGGIYVVSTLGGEPKKIADRGRRPRFSPDGRQIAYWVGTHVAASGAAKIYTVGSSGGAPQEHQPQLAIAVAPIWSPDGKRLLFYGLRAGKGSLEESEDWWLASPEGGEAIPTGAFALFRQQGLLSWPAAGIYPGVWTGQENEVFFSARAGDSVNLWKVGIRPDTGQVTGQPRPLTFGSGLEADPFTTTGAKVVFSSLNENTDLWSVPVDGNQGKVLGEPQRLTPDPAAEKRPALSDDGRRLVFVSNRNGSEDLWLRDLPSGKETALASNVYQGALITRDGSKVGYATRENGKMITYSLSIESTIPQKILADTDDAPWDWSSDGLRILYPGAFNTRMSILNVVSGKQVELIHRPDRAQSRARFSPDGRWISFHARRGPHAQVFIVPVRESGEAPLGDADWIAVTAGESLNALAQWSPDGQLLYFTSNRDGAMCIWAQRLEPATKRPVGAAFAVRHFHETRHALTRQPAWFAMAVVRNRMVFNMDETTGNIWLAEQKK